MCCLTQDKFKKNYMNKNILKKIASSLTIGLLFTVALTSCSGKDAKVFNELEDFKGEQVGVLTGSSFVSTIQKHEILGNEVNLKYYASYSDCIIDLKNKNISSFVVDQFVGKEMEKSDASLSSFYEPIGQDNYAFIFKRNDSIGDIYNREFTLLENQNYLEYLDDKWIYNETIDETMPTLEELNPNYTGNKGVVKIAGKSDNKPFCYLKNNKPAGYEVELINKIFAKLDYRIEYNLAYSTAASLIAAVDGNKGDLGIGSITYTEERTKQINFTNHHFSGDVLLMSNRESFPINSVKDLNNKKVGILLATNFDKTVKKYAPNIDPYIMHGVGEMIVSLENNKIDAGILDDFYASYIENKHKSIKQLSEPVSNNVEDRVQTAFAINKSNPVLVDQMNKTINRLKKENKYDDLISKWTSGDESLRQLDKSKFTFGTKPLTAAITGDLEPYCYLYKGDYVGFEVEIFYEMCQEFGYNPTFVASDFKGMLQNISSNKVPIAFSHIYYTEERAQTLLFSEFTTDCALSIIVHEPVQKGFFESISDSFYNDFIKEDRYLLILNGFGVTIFITLCAALFGIIFGYLLTKLSLARTKWATIPVKVFKIIIQGLPILVILMLLYYVIFANIDIWNILVAIIGFGIYFSVEVSEMLKGSIKAIDIGQEEAALAMGFSRGQAFRRIVLPQAIKLVLPNFRSGFISMLKTTSIVGYIAIMDLTRASDLIRSLTFDAFLPLLVISLGYLLLSYLFILLLKILEKKLTKSDTNRRVKYVKEIER